MNFKNKLKTGLLAVSLVCGVSANVSATSGGNQFNWDDFSKMFGKMTGFQNPNQQNMMPGFQMPNFDQQPPLQQSQNPKPQFGGLNFQNPTGFQMPEQWLGSGQPSQFGGQGFPSLGGFQNAGGFQNLGAFQMPATWFTPEQQQTGGLPTQGERVQNVQSSNSGIPYVGDLDEPTLLSTSQSDKGASNLSSNKPPIFLNEEKPQPLSQPQQSQSQAQSQAQEGEKKCECKKPSCEPCCIDSVENAKLLENLIRYTKFDKAAEIFALQALKTSAMSGKPLDTDGQAEAWASLWQAELLSNQDYLNGKVNIAQYIACLIAPKPACDDFCARIRAAQRFVTMFQEVNRINSEVGLPDNETVQNVINTMLQAALTDKQCKPDRLNCWLPLLGDVLPYASKNVPQGFGGQSGGFAPQSLRDRLTWLIVSHFPQLPAIQFWLDKQNCHSSSTDFSTTEITFFDPTPPY